MSVQWPTGLYTVRRYDTVEDAFASPSRSKDPTSTVTVPGRVRTNASGILLSLDPAAWPTASVPSGRQDIYVTVTGPDVDATTKTWVVIDSSLRKGLDADLDSLSYIEANCRRDE